MILVVILDKSYLVDFTNLLMGLGYELHAYLFLTLQHLCRDRIGLIFEF